jgi:hypothetical protein
VPSEEIAATWLRGLAQDVIDHEACLGCRCNAAQALEHLGALDEVLALLGKDDPRLELRQRKNDASHGAYGSIVQTITEIPPPPA